MGDQTGHIFGEILEQQFVNQLVDIRVVGEWMFTGRFVEVCHKQVILTDVLVTTCSGLTLCTFDVIQVRIQLKDITSVGKPVLDANGG